MFIDFAVAAGGIGLADAVENFSGKTLAIVADEISTVLSVQPQLTSTVALAKSIAFSTRLPSP